MNDYFQEFNYSLANEDNFLEINIAKSLKSKNLLTIAGSGNRSLFLSSTQPDNLTIVDTSKEQLSFCKYKEKLIEENELDQYWQVLKQGPLYSGKYEQTLIKYSKIIKLICGQKNIENFFSCESIDEQVTYYENTLFGFRLKTALRLIGNPIIMNLLLYKGKFVKKNIPQGHGDYYIERFEGIFEKFLLRDHFFAQLIFLGGIKTKTAFICENHPETFQETKMWLNDNRPNYLCTPITQIKESDLRDKVDFVSYSNVPSYYNGELEINYMQELKSILSKDAVIVIRYYLREPTVTNFNGYKDITYQYTHFIEKEKVNMYTIKVYQLIT